MSTLAVNEITNEAGTDSPSFFTAPGNPPVYFCRAWVNLDGTGTVAIRESGNVSSITDNGTGSYTINFSSSMPDNDYSALATHGSVSSGSLRPTASTQSYNSSSVTIRLFTDSTSSTTDEDVINVAIFR